MPAGAIQHHRGVGAGWQLAGELLEERVHRLGVHLRADQSAGISRLRTDGAEDIKVVVLGLPDGAWPAADLRPHAGDRTVLTEACFILVVDPQMLVRMRSSELIKTLGQLFF